MSARDASVDAYHGLHDQESGQLAEFERYVFLHGPCTRAMAGAALSYPANVHSARINKLVKERKLIELVVKAPCEITGVTVGWLVHRKKATFEHIGATQCDGCKVNSGIYTMTNACCAARFVLMDGGDRAATLQAVAHRWGHDEEKLKLLVNITHRARVVQALASSKDRASANEEVL